MHITEPQSIAGMGIKQLAQGYMHPCQCSPSIAASYWYSVSTALRLRPRAPAGAPARGTSSSSFSTSCNATTHRHMQRFNGSRPGGGGAHHLCSALNARKHSCMQHVQQQLQQVLWLGSTFCGPTHRHEVVIDGVDTRCLATVLGLHLPDAPGQRALAAARQPPQHQQHAPWPRGPPRGQQQQPQVHGFQ